MSLRELTAEFVIRADTAPLKKLGTSLAIVKYQAQQASKELGRVRKQIPYTVLGNNGGGVAGIGASGGGTSGGGTSGGDSGKQSENAVVRGLVSAVLLRKAWLLVKGAIRSVTSELIEQAVELKYNAEKLGITTDELQKYQYVSTQMHVSAANTAVAFRFFNRAVGEAGMGTKSAVKVFQQLGISVRDPQGAIRPTADLLFEFAERLEKIPDQATRTALAMRTLGRGGSALLPVLQKGGSDLHEMFKDVEELGGGFNKTFIQDAAKLQWGQKKLAMGYRTLKVAIGTELLPVLSHFMHNGIAHVKLMVDMSKKTYTVRTALLFLAATVAAIGVGFAVFFAITHPALLLLIAAVGAFLAVLTPLYLIFDDIYTSLRGGDSILSRTLDNFGGKGYSFQWWTDLKAIVEDLRAQIFGVNDGTNSLQQILVQAFADAVPTALKITIDSLVAVAALVDTIITGVHQAYDVLKGVGSLFTKEGSMGQEIGADFKEATTAGEAWQRRLEDYKKLINKAGELGQGPKADVLSAQQKAQADAREAAMSSAASARANPSIVIHQTFGPGTPASVRTAAAQGAVSGVKTASVKLRDAHAAVRAGKP